MTRKAAPKAPTKPRAGSKPPRTVGKEDPAFYEALGRAIKVARTELGLDRKDLAERANVSYAYLSDIETGRGRPGSRSLLAIAEALGRSAAELMHEAEVYRARIRGDSPEALALADAPATPVAAAPSRWFHAEPEPPMRRRATASPAAGSQPSIRELRSAWRERLAASEADARAELHAIVDRLSPEDLDAALTIARRLVPPGSDD
ncbi:MAG TPA: helix-turn-helix transcriptional regulator [Actinomycetota bacterium]